MPNTLRQHRIVDPVLTTIVQGYASPARVGELLFPVVLHGKEAGKIPLFGKEAFMAYNTTRAPRGRVQRMDFGTGSVDFVMDEESIEVATDRREQEESVDTLQAESVAARMAERVIQLTHERRCATVATTPANFAGNTTTLAGGAKWSASDTSDPVADVETGKETVRSKVGIRPNLLVLGPLVFKVLKHHPKIIERIKYSQKGIATPELLAAIFDLDQVVVGDAVTADDAGTFSDIWGKNAVLAYTVKPTVADLGTPAFGYTLRKKGRPNAARYFDNSVKSTVAEVEDIFVVKVLAPGAGYLIQTAVA